MKVWTSISKKIVLMYSSYTKKKGDTANKKVKNATRVVVDGIEFKSKLEAYCYERLKQNGIVAKYEAQRFTLLHSFKYNGESVRAMTYTPDFIGDDFIIECKGFRNDAFPLRWKLFKYYLYINKIEVDLYIPKNQKEVDSMVKEILNRKNEREKLLFDEGICVEQCA